MNILADLFLTFAKIGCFTFGGGYAMIALITDACVDKKKWITHDDMMNVTVIAESTPGPIAINCATYVGYKQAGFAGALAATVGMVLPSFLIVFGISRFLDNFLEIEWVAKAFGGIRIAVGILILDAGITMFKKMRQKAKNKRFAQVVVAVAFLAMIAINAFSLRISTIVLMLCGALAGLAVMAGGCGDCSGGAKGPGQRKEAATSNKPGEASGGIKESGVSK